MYYIFIAFLSIFQGVLLVPLNSDSLDDITAQKYLQQFGYLKKTPYNEQLVTGEHWKKQFSDSLKQFQKFAGIPITGKLDEETKKTMTLPRCGVSDEEPLQGNERRKKRYALQGSRWRSGELTYGISKYPSGSNYLSKLSTEVVDGIIKRALEVWSKDTPLIFKRIKSGGVQLDISFHKKSHGDGDPFDGYGGTLAHAFFPQYGGDAHFDDDEFWTVGKSRGTNLFQVAAHEFGHSLGLSHSNVKSSLMAPFYRGFQRDFRLHKDDITAIQTLYGKKKNKEVNPKPRVESPEPDPDKEDDIDNTVGQADGDAPDLCHDSSIDAVVKTKNMFSYVFKGDYYWRIVDEGLADGYPRKVSADWDNLPGNIDAAFTWRDGRTFFFKGDSYWRFTNKRMHPGYPKKIRIGFEGIPDNIDAAIVHSKNKKTYIFKGDKYWRFDSKAKTPVADMYPRSLSSWDGLPNKIDAAFEWKNGKDYFFHGDRYYRLKKGTYTVDRNYPRSTSIWWFGCKADSETQMAGLRMHPELEPDDTAKNDFEIEVRLDHDQEKSKTPVVHSRSAEDPLDTSVIELEFDRADIVPTDHLEQEKLSDKKNNAISIEGTIIVGMSLLISLLI